MSAAKLHPFERSGMGTGPFRFLFAWSFPSTALAEHNPEAYSQEMASMPRGLEGGCGTCRHCGRPIRTICVVANSDGTRFGVGCECVEKTGASSLGDRVEVEMAVARRKAARAHREALRMARAKAWLEEHSVEVEAKKAAEAERVRAATEARLARARSIEARWGRLFPMLERYGATSSGGFAASMLASMRDGNEPQGRAAKVLADMWGRSHGRSGSKAYWEAIEELEAAVVGEGGAS